MAATPTRRTVLIRVVSVSATVRASGPTGVVAIPSPVTVSLVVGIISSPPRAACGAVSTVVVRVVRVDATPTTAPARPLAQPPVVIVFMVGVVAVVAACPVRRIAAPRSRARRSVRASRRRLLLGLGNGALGVIAGNERGGEEREGGGERGGGEEKGEEREEGGRERGGETETEGGGGRGERRGEEGEGERQRQRVGEGERRVEGEERGRLTYRICSWGTLFCGHLRNF